MDVFTVLRVRLTPKGGRNALDGITDGVLAARVSAPPVDGAANRALIALLSEKLAVPKSRISFIGGETSRIKTIRIDGIDDSDLHSRISKALTK